MGDAPMDDAAALPADNFLAWERVLDELQQELRRPEPVADLDDDGSTDAANVTDAHRAPAWRPPVGLGPLPAELVERAREIAAAQQAMLSRLGEQRADAARHLAALRTVPSTRVTGASVYLDVAG